MNEREAKLFLGCKQGMDLFRVATPEQEKEIKKEFFGTDNNFALMDIFKEMMANIRPSERDVVWNVLMNELGMEDLDMTMEQVLDHARAKMIYDSIPILDWGMIQPLPQIAHMDDGTAYTIQEIPTIRGDVLPAEPITVYADPECTRPIPTCRVSSPPQQN